MAEKTIIFSAIVYKIVAIIYRLVLILVEEWINNNILTTTATNRQAYFAVKIHKMR